MAYRKNTLRKMPPHTRKVARLLNDLESVHRRFKNLMDETYVLEMYARGSMKATAAMAEEVKE